MNSEQHSDRWSRQKFLDGTLGFANGMRVIGDRMLSLFPKIFSGIHHQHPASHPKFDLESCRAVKPNIFRRFLEVWSKHDEEKI